MEARRAQLRGGRQSGPVASIRDTLGDPGVRGAAAMGSRWVGLEQYLEHLELDCCIGDVLTPIRAILTLIRAILTLIRAMFTPFRAMSTLIRGIWPRLLSSCICMTFTM